MEIKFKDMNKLYFRAREEFYNETLYIQRYKKYIRKHTNKKVGSITKILKKREIYTVIFGVCVALYSWKFKADYLISMILLGIFVFMFIYHGLILFVCRKSLKKLVNNEREQVLVINNEGISFNDGFKVRSLEWSRIESIIINNYSVTFVSDSYVPTVICVPSTYKEMMVQAIKEEGYIDLVVNNRNKYLK